MLPKDTGRLRGMGVHSGWGPLGILARAQALAHPAPQRLPDPALLRGLITQHVLHGNQTEPVSILDSEVRVSGPQGLTFL